MKVHVNEIKSCTSHLVLRSLNINLSGDKSLMDCGLNIHNTNIVPSK